MGKNKLLHPSLVLLLLVFLPTHASVSGKPHYMVLVPSLLHSGTPEKGCLLLNHLNETVTVSASLESLRENRSLFTDLVVEKDLFQCISFTVPQTSSNEVMFLTVQVKGATQEFRKRSTVMIQKKQSLIFVQTDKPIYKPGQIVKFRIVSVDESFHPLNELDPKGNRIAQWQSLKLESGLKQLSFPLSSEPLQGTYLVVVRTESGEKNHQFTVEEFVLPKFEVQVTMPKTITILEEVMNVSVCGLQGCFSQQVKTKSFQLKRQEYEMRLKAEAKIQEEGTDVEETGRASTEITRTITKLSFVKVDSNFRHGIPFSGQVRLQDGKGVPMPNQLIFITANEADYQSNATTDEHGLVQFSINTTKITGNSLTVRVNHSPCYSGYRWLTEENEEAQHTASAVFSPSKSFLHVEPMPGKLPCGQTQIIQAHYILNGWVLQEQKELVFYYLIMAKGNIVRTGTHVLPVEQGDLKGHFSVSLPVDSDLAPIARLLIFAILPDGEMFGDSAKYDIENCLDNKVSKFELQPSTKSPASHSQLQVSASPHSLCALRVVDQSVLLMKPEAELSASSVYELLPIKDLSDFPGGLSLEEENEECVDHHNVYINGILYYPVSNTNEKDMYMPSLFPYLVLIMLFIICIFVECMQVVTTEPFIRVYFLGKIYSHAYLLSFTSPSSSSSGVTELGVTVPDTITEWKAGAFCLSNDTGLGFSPTVSFRAFQPFFVELTMPYSVIRGEAFTLKATVLNYLPECIRVSVQLEASPAFLSVPVESEQGSHCICGNGRHTLSWAVTPKTLGNVNFTVSAEALKSQEPCGTEVAVVPEHGKKDTIIKPLLVEPEGLEKEVTSNSLLCLSGAEVSEQLLLKLPPNVVEESARASISVLGDILASAMQNTQNLLKMPYGCGEQNMVLFAPNIYVLDYLNETQQLTNEIKSKAIGYLNTGYQRQLNYKHHDGSYSTFGEKHGRSQGNTWLTAFVLKTFAQARRYIYIDEEHITQALLWLSQKQKDNGCFRSSGSLLNNAIKGGVEDEVTLSAYITIALLEIPLSVTHPVVRNALFCLESAWKSAKEGAHGSHVYTKALLAYAFSLAGNQDKRKEIMKSLDEEAVKEGNSVHWTRPQKPRVPVGLLFQPQASSAEVEMTAYVLLAYLTTQPAPTSEDLTFSANIVRWITKQQNSHGGFSSTQDTVVALHALSKYGAATFTRTGKAVQVTIQSSGTFSKEFQVNNNNRLLLQRVSLERVPGEYSIKATGEGCVYLQTSLKYNILPKKEEFPFALEVQTLPQTCDGHKARTSFQISLNISYIGSRSASNMAIADVKMVSGFIPLKPTVKMLEGSDHVSRTEVSNNHVLIYLNKVSNQILSLSFTVLQDIPVRDLKPAIVKVYDYYETDEFAIAEYSAPCSKGKTCTLLQNFSGLSLKHSS
uniref:Alpha-2-macroglobulin n=1 Tax=Castor canadensis TaxID=51338 RepID=A0A8C0XV30_CASCN